MFVCVNLRTFMICGRKIKNILEFDLFVNLFLNVTYICIYIGILCEYKVFLNQRHNFFLQRIKL
jgi:hypothetical protein